LKRIIHDMEKHRDVKGEEAEAKAFSEFIKLVLEKKIRFEAKEPTSDK
jgi:hypothetical protein